MNSGDLSVTICFCVVVLYFLVKMVVRRNRPYEPEPELPQTPWADSPTEVWTAYYDSCARANEAFFAARADAPVVNNAGRAHPGDLLEPRRAGRGRRAEGQGGRAED